MLATRVNFTAGLGSFLPRSHQALLSGLKQALLSEPERFNLGIALWQADDRSWSSLDRGMGQLQAYGNSVALGPSTEKPCNKLTPERALVYQRAH